MSTTSLRSLPPLEKNERVVVVLRRHWLILALKLALWTIAAVVPIGVSILTTNAGLHIGGSEILKALITLGLSTYLLCILLFAFASFVDYYLDIWVVTTERIISIEQHGAFARTVAEQWLYRIQDVTAEQHGILPTFFDYGAVHIQSAGEQARFVFEQVPHPRSVARQVIDIAEQCKIHHHLLDTENSAPTKRAEAQE
jgi:hypothetical protein